MKVVKLKAEEYEEYARKHFLGNFYQSIFYGNLMAKFGFKPNYIGFIQNDHLIGASLILDKPIFMGFKYGYAPHGLLINYENYKIIPELIKKLKRFLFNQSFLILKIDPLIVKSIRDKDGNILQSNEEIDNIMTILKKHNFVHCGFNNYMESVKPRWHAIIDMRGKSAEELFFNLDKNIRNKLRKAAKFGVEIFKDNSANVESMYEFIKDKGNYSLRYYNEFKKAFGDEFQIYLARINTESYVMNSKQLYEKESEINDYLNNVIQNEGFKGKDMRSILNKKMESDKILASYKKHLVVATNLLKEYPNNLIIGGAIVINHNNKLYLLIDGFKQQYGNLCPGFLTKWKIMEKYSNSNIIEFDLNAIVGNFSNNNQFKGLNDSKLGYNCAAVEYIGEFNLIINKTVYSLYRNTKDKYSLKEPKK